MKIKDVFAKIINNERYWPVFILVLSVFVIFFQLNGSLGAWDESTYSEIAKEGIMKNSWVETYYQGEIWMEKPPLTIWLTMISYKIFGISEISSRLFPVIFGVVGILTVYFLGKYLFNSRVGLISSFILLEIPHYLLMSRSNMMDIFVTVFTALAFVFVLRSFKNKKEIIFSGLFLALAFMSKSVVSLFFVPIFLIHLWFRRDFSIVKNKYFVYAIVLFLLVVIPWHLTMTLKYGGAFIGEYFGFHVIKRFNENILGLSYASDSLFYLRVILQRSASWWLVFLILLPVIYRKLKNIEDSPKVKFLLVWALLIVLFFSLSVTKLHHYILPFYIPFSLLIGYAVYCLIKLKTFLVLPLLLAIYVNLLPESIKKAADYGESRLLVPKIINFYNFPISVFYLIITITAIYFLLKFLKKDFSGAKTIICLVLFFSFLLPFSPDRKPEAKIINREIIEKGAKTVYLYDTHYLANHLIFYGYPQYNVVKLRYGQKNNIEELKTMDGSKSLCIIKDNISASFNLFSCRVSK